MTKKTEPAEASDPTSEKNNFQASQLRASRKVRSSTGGFSDDTIWPIVEMHRHNYRVKNDPILLEQIIKTLEPLLETDISEAIIKCIKAQGPRTYGIKRAKEDELIIEQYHILRNCEPHMTSKAIREILAQKFNRNSPENIRKLLEKNNIL